MRIVKNLFVPAAAAWLVVIGHTPLVAAAQTVQTPVMPACAIISATPVSFGLYSVFRAEPTDSTGALSFMCTGATGNVSIGLSGAGADGARAMTSGAESMAYNIYMDAGRTQVWGDGTSGAGPAVYSRPADATTMTAVMYGRVFAGQDIMTGSYSTSLIATINF